MTRKYSVSILIVVLALLAISSGSAFAKELDAYVFKGTPGRENIMPPEGGGGGWIKLSGRDSVTVKPRSKTYVAWRNDFGETWTKDFTVVLPKGWDDNLTYEFETFNTGDASDPAKKRSHRRQTLESKYVLHHYRYTPQPEWDRIVFINDTDDEQTVTNFGAYSECTESKKNGSRYMRNNASFNAVGAVTGAADIREIYIFPQAIPVNIGTPAYFSAHSGAAWGYEWVYTDPVNNPRPLGGVRFYAMDTGLDTGDKYDAEFTMINSLENRFDVYAFDASDGEYMIYTQDISHLSYPSNPTWGDGDVNRDNIVNGLDLSIAMIHYGRPAFGWGQGNMDADFDVDDDDIDIINMNMGRFYPENGPISGIEIINR